jgi:hypothetical protein
MPFSSLVDEILVQISNLVGSPDIDNFALVNKAIYRVCYNSLKKRKLVKENAKVMAERFNYKHDPSGSSWWENSGEARLWRKEMQQIGSLPNACALKHVEYLELNGDLSWLGPIDEASAKEAPKWWQGEAASQKELDEVQATAKRLGLQLPPGFLRMMGSNDCIGRMYLGGDYFSLGSFVKCNPADDQNGGGYVIQFLSDQQGCGYWNLYITPDGYHCVVRSTDNVECWRCSDRGPNGGPYGTGPVDFEGHEKYKTHEGIPIACEDLELRFDHPNFEAWLAMRYFGGWCYGTLSNKGKLDERQLEYLDYFRSRIRKQFLEIHMQCS